MRKASFVPTMYLTLGLALTPAAAFANHGGFHGGRVAVGQVAGRPAVTRPCLTHPFVPRPVVARRPAPANSIAGPTNGTSCTGRIAGTPYRSGTGPRRSKPSRPRNARAEVRVRLFLEAAVERRPVSCRMNRDSVDVMTSGGPP